MTKEMYISKEEELLNETNFYIRPISDPTRSIQNKLAKILTKEDGMISREQFRKLIRYNSIISKFHVLPKVHKPPLTFRPIIPKVCPR